MSREFTSSSSQYLQVDSVPATQIPITISCWFYATNNTNNQCLVYLGDKNRVNVWFTLLLMGNTAGDPVEWWPRVNDTPPYGPATTTGYSLNQWHHACGVSATQTDHRVYLDGENKGTWGTYRHPTGIDRLAIGGLRDSSPGAYLDGRVAEVGIWNVGLTDDEVSLLAKGVSPLFVRRESLRFYLPMVRNHETDVIGGRVLTPGNNPTVGEHPRIFYPAPLRKGGVASASTSTRRVTLDDRLLTVSI